MSTPDLHFGAVLSLGLEETTAESKWLEGLGYSFLGTGEHFMRTNPPGPSSAALPVLATAAGSTKSIKLVSSVLLAPFYHPTVLGKMALTLDIVSGGRLVLGVGIGGEFPEEFSAANVPIKHRGTRTEECLDILRRLWTGERVDYNGRHFTLNGVVMDPVAFGGRHIPIWVAGRKDKAMYRAASLGDGWFPYFYSPERYRYSVDQITEFSRNIRRPLDQFQWANFQFISIYDKKHEAAMAACEALGGRYKSSTHFAKLVESYCVYGTVDDCIRRIQEYVDAGARSFLFSWACRPEDKPRHIEIVAEKILPHFCK